MSTPIVFLPDHATKVDLLYFDSIASTITNLILTHGDRPLSLGVHGDWGAGKSSILEMVEAGLGKEENVLCLKFNGWQFQGLEDAKAALMESIITELRDARSGFEKVKEKAADLLHRVNYFKLAKMGLSAAFTISTGIPHPDHIKDAASLLSGLTDSLSKEFTPKKVLEDVAAASKLLDPKVERVLPEEVRTFQKEFSELIKATKVTNLVILIDDLDRCLPHTTIGTLEAIRLFLFSEKTTFIIAADEAMIEYCVRQHFPDLPAASGPISYARNYLEKLIQVPFRIPALGYVESELYVSLTIAEGTLGSVNASFQTFLGIARNILKKPWLADCTGNLLADVSLKNLPREDIQKLNEAIQLSRQIGRILNDGSQGNPRQIKRFLNNLFIRERVAHERGLDSDFKRQVLAKVMLAEFFAPTFFKDLRNATYAAINGKSPEIRALEADIAADKEPDTGRFEALQSSKPDWFKHEWARDWAKIDPPLADVDLRPYHFLTAEKRTYFGGNPTFAHLNTLLQALTTGTELAIQGRAEDIGKLNLEEAQTLFDALKHDIESKERYGDQPHGLIILTQKHPKLEDRLVQFLRGIPVSKLGVWATKITCLSESKTPSVVDAYKVLFAEWNGQSENKHLLAATKFTSNLRTRKK